MSRRELCVVAETHPLQPTSEHIPDCDDRTSLLRTLASLCRTSFNRFPGGNPVSVEFSHLDTVSREKASRVDGCAPYLVALKSDGIRYLLLLCEFPDGDPVAVMIDRNMTCYEVCIWCSRDFFELGTVFDGELVWDYCTSPPRLVYIVFDILCFKGEQLSNTTYTVRMQTIHNVIYNASLEGKHEKDIMQTMLEQQSICAMNNPFSMRMVPKKVSPASNIQMVWESRLSSPYRCDGLLFTHDAYVSSPGTSQRMLKWKPHHTIDVFAEIAKAPSSSGPAHPAMLSWRLTVGYEEDWHDVSTNLTLQDGRALRVFLENNDLLNCIAASVPSRPLVLECACELTQDESVLKLFCMKVRKDKNSPNSLFTVQKTVQNIRENVSIAQLASAFGTIVA